MNWFGFELSAFLWVFIILNIVNVVIQTVKSIVTVNGGRWSASIVNAVAYGLYTVVVVYMNADGLGIFWKALIIGLANLVGVYVVKLIEEKSRKDKLWKIEATFDIDYLEEIHKNVALSHSYIEVGDHVIFNFYAENQRQSAIAKDIIQKYNGKYFVSESKVL